MTILKKNKKWKIYVIHHSHTDIGYTERQEKIEQFHVDFIKQAVAICNAAHSGEKEEWTGYKWTCETFWAVERFLEQASEEEREQFAEVLHRGDIELSGTYLNMTELAGYDLLTKMLEKSGNYAREINLNTQVKSAMTADITGYSWGYSQAMADAGIENLLSCVHTHHSMFPIGRKQFPFYWETPKGGRILVWNGEHYMFGNDLGLNPDAVLSYTLRGEDEYSVWGIAKDHWQLAEDRIFRYINQLELEQYPFHFLLVNVMGLLNDNASPNPRVITFIKEWNQKHGNQVEIKMTTLNQYFDLVREQSVEIPVYRGDWPDWWSDGVNSTPMQTQIFRDAQRMLRVVRKLEPNVETIQGYRIREAEYQLMMYAEHTWGYHSSIKEPWHFMVQQLGVRKEAYAANASRLVYATLDEVLKQQGEVMLRYDRKLTYRVVNPYSYAIEDVAHFYLDSYSELDRLKDGLEVVEESTGSVIPHQLERVSRGNQIEIVVRLEANETKSYFIRHAQDVKAKTASSTRLSGQDRVYDLTDLFVLKESSPEQKLTISEHSIESPYIRIDWAEGDGINSWYDKRTGKEWLADNRLAGAFTPIYERTPANDSNQVQVRGSMGRNRKGMNVQRSIGKLCGVKKIAEGSVYGIVELTYAVAGMSHYSVYLKAYKELARIDVSVRIHKDSVWDPENVFISLPFTQENSELWLDKPGGPIRPGTDQLPGTLIDYYCIQEGLALLSPEGSMLLATPDTPLLQTGPIKHQPRKLNGQKPADRKEPLYSWPLSNYWETNFKATLGGFYEFRYRLQFDDQWETPEHPLEICQAINTGTIAYRTK
ncbi:glycoside hydrolase family 38 N-terminal domain-containing protein [Paenibacillus roseipurpureus]|uniref:Glycoside hydrolase n=1 Tax=Paenibacillus roseopurpureus TaxID=2918901 RepID=A0AA96RIY0_9BACL|nr:glycoside hydrolase [Paenibacillus sp. MBLB1832]WNR42724.1 glycoside hydrolase [Paenibacillus sp. MBLB1832]